MDVFFGASLVRPTTAQSVKQDELLESWVVIAATTSLKELATHWSSQSNNVYESARLV